MLLDKKLALRLTLVLLLLASFYQFGLPLEALFVLGVVFVILVLLRGKIWKAVDKMIERFLPFTKTWPDWTQKVLLVVFFIIIYLALKQVIYFALGLMGIDLQEIILSAFAGQEN